MAEKTFEQAITELEGVVTKLESGDISLDDSIKLFNEGMNLSALCNEKLSQVNSQIELLTEVDGEINIKKGNIKKQQ